MRFFGGRKRRAAREARQASPYTDAVTAAIISAAGQDAVADQTASALEVAAGVHARAMGSAVVEGMDVAPSMLAAIARDLITIGECIVVLVDDELVRASHWEVSGRSASPATWMYRLMIPVPDGEVERTISGMSVAHPRYSTDRERPWIGIGPIGRALHVSGLLAALEASLRQESGTSVGYLLPVPTDGQDATVESLRSDIRNLRGRTALVETTAGGWGDGRTAAPTADWRPQRIGPAPPEPVVTLHDAATRAVLAACGVPVELVTHAEGTGQREAWRRFLHGSVQPIASLVAEEFSKLAGRPVTLSFDALMASDISGRARAFQSMVGGGMDVQSAAELSGLMAGEG